MGSGDHSSLPIQLQAMEIIEEILSSASPGEADVRESLRRHVANHPGQPEKALLMHMLTVRQPCQGEGTDPRDTSIHRMGGRKPMGCESVQQQEASHLNALLNQAGVTLWDLWLRYYSLGGEASEAAVAAQLRGELSLPGMQQQILRIALTELSAEESPDPDGGIDLFALGEMRSLRIAPDVPLRYR